MGIWDAKEDAAYLRRATEQRLVGDRYILKVVRSNIAEVIGNQDVTLNTRIYFNRNASATRSGGMEMPGAKYIDGQNVIHPAAITFITPSDENGTTRGATTSSVGQAEDSAGSAARYCHNIHNLRCARIHQLRHQRLPEAERNARR